MFPPQSSRRIARVAGDSGGDGPRCHFRPETPLRAATIAQDCGNRNTMSVSPKLGLVAHQPTGRRNRHGTSQCSRRPDVR
jgi:hypothetical protein